jgi:copper oxidase (laccase) domain-containing protein
LRALNGAILEQTGVPAKQIFSVGPCTRCGAEDFYSYRRAGADTGRQMSFIGWRE